MAQKDITLIEDTCLGKGKVYLTEKNRLIAKGYSLVKEITHEAVGKIGTFRRINLSLKQLK